ncbi:MAG: hypothetical protein BWY76_01542 [bacterium ADurb.Bin429]|nr:MAG: hypothetical protein BWY76_01542 [bacterium ADurb.Bin429]
MVEHVNIVGAQRRLFWRALHHREQLVERVARRSQHFAHRQQIAPQCEDLLLRARRRRAEHLGIEIINLVADLVNNGKVPIYDPVQYQIEEKRRGPPARMYLNPALSHRVKSGHRGFVHSKQIAVTEQQVEFVHRQFPRFHVIARGAQRQKQVVVVLIQLRALALVAQVFGGQRVKMEGLGQPGEFRVVWRGQFDPQYRVRVSEQVSHLLERDGRDVAGGRRITFTVQHARSIRQPGQRVVRRAQQHFFRRRVESDAAIE